MPKFSLIPIGQLQIYTQVSKGGHVMQDSKYLVQMTRSFIGSYILLPWFDGLGAGIPHLTHILLPRIHSLVHTLLSALLHVPACSQTYILPLSRKRNHATRDPRQGKRCKWNITLAIF
jgi:hypothetical protein